MNRNEKFKNIFYKIKFREKLNVDFILRTNTTKYSKQWAERVSVPVPATWHTTAYSHWNEGEAKRSTHYPQAYVQASHEVVVELA